MANKLLIIGGTNKICSYLVKGFHESDLEIKVLTRHHKRKFFIEGVNYITGSIFEPEELAASISDCNFIYVNYNGFAHIDYRNKITEGTQNIINAINGAKSTLKKVIIQSNSLFNESTKWFEFAKVKLEMEQLFKEQCEVPFIIAKPSMLFESMDFFIRGNQINIFGDLPNEYYWLSFEDYFQFLKEEIHKNNSGKTFYIYGPEKITINKALEKYCSIKKPTAKFTSISPKMFASLGLFTNNPELLVTSKMIEFYNKALEPETFEPNEELVKTTITIEDWSNRE